MQYKKSLPRMTTILELAKSAGPFPKQNKEIIRYAKIWHYSRSVIDFLRLFPEDETFENGLEFVTRCEEVEFLIREERKLLNQHLSANVG